MADFHSVSGERCKKVIGGNSNAKYGLNSRDYDSGEGRKRDFHVGTKTRNMEIKVQNKRFINRIKAEWKARDFLYGVKEHHFRRKHLPRNVFCVSTRKNICIGNGKTRHGEWCKKMSAEFRNVHRANVSNILCVFDFPGAK